MSQRRLGVHWAYPLETVIPAEASTYRKPTMQQLSDLFGSSARARPSPDADSMIVQHGAYRRNQDRAGGSFQEQSNSTRQSRS